MKIIRVIALFFVMSISASAVAETRTHTVQEGETLWRIAEYELGSGDRWSEIAELNFIDAPNDLKKGRVLLLPGAESESAPGELSVNETGNHAESLNQTVQFPPTESELEIENQGNVQILNDYQLTQEHRSSIRDEFRSAYEPSGESETGNVLEIESFENAVALAMKHNAEFKAIADDVEAARAGLVTADLAGRFNPEIEIEGARRYAAPEGGGPGNNFTDWGVGISREFEIGGQRGFRISVAEREVQVAFAEAERVRRRLLYEIKETFTNCVERKDALELSRISAVTKMELAELVRLRFEVGDVSGVEISLAEVDGLRAHNEFLASKLKLVSSLDELRIAIGLSENMKIQVNGSLSPPKEEAESLLQYRMRAVQERQDLQILRIEAKLEEERAKLAMAEGRPNVVFGMGYNNEEGADVFTGRFGIPFPLTNQNKGEAKRSRSASAAAKKRADALERAIRIEVSSAYGSIKTAAARYQILAGRVEPQSKENLRLLKESYQEGKVGLAEVMLLQGQTLEAKRELLEAIAEYNQVKLELEIAIGIDLSKKKRGDLK